jgi:FtsP/CotA-like multicopper oxidase with cupredoxin domain
VPECGGDVKIRSASRKAGDVVEILGSNLTGATSVSFSGTPAPFTVASASVPTGATSGTIEVATPGATLSGYRPFKVLP